MTLTAQQPQQIRSAAPTAPVYMVCPLCGKSIAGLHRLATHLRGSIAHGGHGAR